MTLKLAGRNTAFAMDQWDLTGYYNEYKFKRDADLIDVTTFGQRFSDYLAGIQKSHVELKGFMSPGEGAVDQLIHKRFGQDPDVNIALCPAGYEADDPAILMPTVIVKYDLSTKIKDAVHVDSEFAVRGAIDDGYIGISPKVPTSGTTGTSSVYDNTNDERPGTTVAGATLQVHAFAVTGTTPSFVVKLQHSTDGTTWTDVLTTTAITAPSAQRLVAPFGTSINSHVRIQWTATGTNPSAKLLACWARGVDYS